MFPLNSLGTRLTNHLLYLGCSANCLELRRTLTAVRYLGTRIASTGLSNQWRFVRRQIENRQIMSRQTINRQIEIIQIDSQYWPLQPMKVREKRQIKTDKIRTGKWWTDKLTALPTKKGEKRPIENRQIEIRHFENRHIKNRQIEIRCIMNRQIDSQYWPLK